MVNKILTFRDLDAWEAAMDMVVAVYRLAALLPNDERYVLSAQMHRAAISIPANVAEGHCRRSPRTNINHVKIALGSQAELETQPEIARRLRFINDIAFADAARLGNRLRPLLHGLRRSIARRHGLSETD